MSLTSAATLQSPRSTGHGSLADNVVVIDQKILATKKEDKANVGTY